jgi:hypothetical protein
MQDWNTVDTLMGLHLCFTFQRCTLVQTILIYKYVSLCFRLTRIKEMSAINSFLKVFCLHLLTLRIIRFP